MYSQPIVPQSHPIEPDEPSAAAESRRNIGRCLRHAFAVGDVGSFVSLLDAIADDIGAPSA